MSCENCGTTNHSPTPATDGRVLCQVCLVAVALNDTGLLEHMAARKLEEAA
jgi:hypothetical protein